MNEKGNKGRVEGKVAVITGSTYGIGESIAKVLSSEGAVSIVTGRTEKEGEKTVDEIISSGGRAEYFRMDVTEEDRVKQVAKDVKNKYGKVDILVNNAGVSGPNKPLHKYSREEWEKVFEVNVTGAFLCSKTFIPHIIEAGGGSIIYISSIYGIVGAADVPAYHATKAANRIMAKNDALMYAKDNIRVNSVHPGFIWTPMVADFLEKTSKDLGIPTSSLKKEINERHPIGHMGEPEDIAYGVLYLVSDEAGFVTGEELVIDGGYTTR